MRRSMSVGTWAGAAGAPFDFAVARGKTGIGLAGIGGRVGIGGAAGFTGIAMEPCNLSLDVALGRGLEAAVASAFEIGPASRALEGHPPETRTAATNSVREALAAFAKGDTVPLPASIWIVTANAS